MNESPWNQPPPPHPHSGQGPPRPNPPGWTQQPGQPQGQPPTGYSSHQPYPHAPLQSQLRPRSTRGAKTMTFIGAGVLLVGVVSLVFAIIGLISILPTGIIDGDGSPGPDALLTIESAEPASLEAVGDTAYALWQVTGAQHDLGLSPSDVRVSGPNGELVPVGGPSVSAYSNVNGAQSQTFGEFRATQPGPYRVEIPASVDADRYGRVIVAEASGFASFFDGVLGTTVLMFTGVGGLIIGLALTIAGSIWWRTANRHNRRLAQSDESPATQPPSPVGPAG